MSDFDEIPIEIDEEGQPTNLHIITHEQIDAAALWANTQCEPIDHMIWFALHKLNIERCEGCNGEGKTYSRTGSMKEEPMEWPCSVCAKYTGRGWVIGGEDE